MSASTYDLRVLANSIYYLSDRKKLAEMDMPFVEREMVEYFTKKFEDTYIGNILRENHLAQLRGVGIEVFNSEK